MKIAVYGLPECRELAAFATGAQRAGHVVKWRNHNVYKSGEAESEFDLIVLSGSRQPAPMIRAEHAALGIPSLTIDYGYLRRCNGVREFESGYWQVGVGGLNAIPTFDCPVDRLRELDLPVPARQGDPDGAVVILGQHVGDPSHPFRTAEELRDFAAAIVRELKAANVDRVIAWRPHPASGDVGNVPGATTIPATIPFAEVLASAGRVVTWSSNGGLDAILAGVPVYAASAAPYAELANRLDDVANVERALYPTGGEILSYLRRASYAQWSLAELELGAELPFVLAWATGQGPAYAAELIAAAPQSSPAGGDSLDQTDASLVPSGVSSGVSQPAGTRSRKRRAR